MIITLPLTVKQLIIICVLILVTIFILTKLGFLNINQESDTKSELFNLLDSEAEAEGGFESKGEKLCRAFLENFFKKKFPKTRPDFLKNPIADSKGYKHNLELDCYCEELKLAVEYNGRQHYKFVPYFHNNIESFNNQCSRDQIKKHLCKENGIHLISVPYTVPYADIPTFLYGSLLAMKNLKVTNASI